MVRSRKSSLTFDSLFFATPEQKIMRFLFNSPTTSFPIRAMSTRLKGVRGLGGAEGLTKILTELQEAGMVSFVDHERAVRLVDDHCYVQVLKTFSALCDLEGLKASLEPISSKGILFGSHAQGRACTDAEYDLFVVTSVPEEIRKTASHHPLGKLIALTAWTPEHYQDMEKKDKKLALKLATGIVLWGESW